MDQGRDGNFLDPRRVPTSSTVETACERPREQVADDAVTCRGDQSLLRPSTADRSPARSPTYLCPRYAYLRPTPLPMCSGTAVIATAARSSSRRRDHRSATSVFNAPRRPPLTAPMPRSPAPITRANAWWSARTVAGRRAGPQARRAVGRHREGARAHCSPKFGLEPPCLVDQVAQRLAGEEAAAIVENDLVAALVEIGAVAGGVRGQQHAGRGP